MKKPTVIEGRFFVLYICIKILVMENILPVINEFKKIENVKAIVLSGSRTANSSDEISDYDIYIYSDAEINLDERTKIAKMFSDKYEIDNRFFGPGDEWILRNSDIQIDVMYRSTEWIENCVENTWVKHYPSVGYSTCFIFNIKNSEIIYDPEGWYKNLHKKVSSEYPDELSKNIIKNNLPLLKNKISASFYEQTEKAIKRKDYVSLNHRISAFIASYFDVLFAVNKVLHPGEKRLVKYTKLHCAKIPENFEEDINNITRYPLENTLEILSRLNENLMKII